MSRALPSPDHASFAALPAGVAIAAASMLCLVTLAVPVMALEGDQDQPIYIEADSVELDDIKDTSVYIGNVQVDQGTMRILADHVTVQHKEDRRPQLITALGNPVRYRQDVEGDKGEVHAQAQRMDYDADKDELTLIDQAVLTQANDLFSSDRIVYDRARSQVKAGASAQGSGRVKITFTPESAKGPDQQGGSNKSPAKGPAPGKGKGKGKGGDKP